MEIIYYENNKGEIPVKDFIDNSSQKDKVRMAKTILLLVEQGSLLRRPYAAQLEDGINELRIKGTDNQLRILYFYIVDNKAVLTHGFIKKTDKIPRKEIDKAKEYRKDFNNRRTEK